VVQGMRLLLAARERVLTLSEQRVRIPTSLSTSPHSNNPFHHTGPIPTNQRRNLLPHYHLSRLYAYRFTKSNNRAPALRRTINQCVIRQHQYITFSRYPTVSPSRSGKYGSDGTVVTRSDAY
jgi:hypothetical protein